MLASQNVSLSLSLANNSPAAVSHRQDTIAGAPFGSFVDYVLDDAGNPVLLMNEMSMHTLNIQNNPSGLVTLFAQLSSGNSQNSPNGQDVSRCSVTGTIAKIDPSAPDYDALKMRYGISHSYADQVMDSPKFHFYRLSPASVYYVGGFGVQATWVPVNEYQSAQSDILAGEAGEIVDRLNREHVEDLKLVGREILQVDNIEKVRVTVVDRLGMDVRVTYSSAARRRNNRVQTDEFRVGFRIPVISVEDAKSEVLKVFQEAWEKGEGVTWGGGEVPGSDIPVLKTAEDSLM